MLKLLCQLRMIFEAFGFGKSSTKTSTVKNIHEAVAKTQTGFPMFPVVSEDYLQQIVEQVRIEGFHVESQAIFRYGNLKPSESIFAIEQWAKMNGLRVGINHEHGICFFEKL